MTTMHRLTLIAAAVLAVSSCRSLAPTEVRTSSFGLGPADEREKIIPSTLRDVSAYADPDSLRFVIRSQGGKHPVLSVFVGLSTGGAGIDYGAGFSGVWIDSLRNWEGQPSPPGVGFRQFDSIARMTIAWRDLPPRSPKGLPWVVNVYGGGSYDFSTTYWLGTRRGVLSNVPQPVAL